jgi:hypothetical protein
MASQRQQTRTLATVTAALVFEITKTGEHGPLFWDLALNNVVRCGTNRENAEASLKKLIINVAIQLAERPSWKKLISPLVKEICHGDLHLIDKTRPLPKKEKHENVRPRR